MTLFDNQSLLWLLFAILIIISLLRSITKIYNFFVHSAETNQKNDTFALPCEVQVLQSWQSHNLSCVLTRLTPGFASVRVGHALSKGTTVNLRTKSIDDFPGSCGDISCRVVWCRSRAEGVGCFEWGLRILNRYDRFQVAAIQEFLEIKRKGPPHV